jgi:DNA-binding response OmpR family regulator
VAEAPLLDPNRIPVLIVEDGAETQLIYEKFLKGSLFQAIPVYTVREAQRVMQQIQPGAIILDILLPGGESWQWLAELKDTEATRDMPIIVATTVDDPRKGLALGADAYCLKPIERQWLLEQLNGLVPTWSGVKLEV